MEENTENKSRPTIGRPQKQLLSPSLTPKIGHFYPRKASTNFELGQIKGRIEGNINNKCCSDKE